MINFLLENYEFIQRRAGVFTKRQSAEPGPVTATESVLGENSKHGDGFYCPHWDNIVLRKFILRTPPDHSAPSHQKKHHKPHTFRIFQPSLNRIPLNGYERFFPASVSSARRRYGQRPGTDPAVSRPRAGLRFVQGTCTCRPFSRICFSSRFAWSSAAFSRCAPSLRLS